MTWIYMFWAGISRSKVAILWKEFFGFSSVSLDLDLPSYSWHRVSDPSNHSVPSQLTNLRFSLFPLSARGIFSLRLWQVHERSHNHGTGDDRLPNLEYWLSRSHHLPKYQGYLKGIFKKNLFFLVGNEQVQGGIDKSEAPVGKTAEGCQCYAGSGS